MFTLTMTQVAALNAAADALGLETAVLVFTDPRSGVSWTATREGRGWTVNEAATVQYSNGDREATVRL